jgi:hypothetical protein
MRMVCENNIIVLAIKVHARGEGKAKNEVDERVALYKIDLDKPQIIQGPT